MPWLGTAPCPGSGLQEELAESQPGARGSQALPVAQVSPARGEACLTSLDSAALWQAQSQRKVLLGSPVLVGDPPNMDNPTRGIRSQRCFPQAALGWAGSAAPAGPTGQEGVTPLGWGQPGTKAGTGWVRPARGKTALAAWLGQKGRAVDKKSFFGKRREKLIKIFLKIQLGEAYVPEERRSWGQVV